MRSIYDSKFDIIVFLAFMTVSNIPFESRGLHTSKHE